MIEHISIYLLMAQDILEIGFLSFICYHMLSWLKQVPILLTSCYLYAFLFITSFILQLTTICTLLEISLPFFIITLVLIRVQTHKQIALSDEPVNSSDLFEDLVRLCLRSTHNLQFLIEQSIDIQDALIISLPLQNHYSNNLLSYLIDCNRFNAQQYILLNSKGDLLGINCSWKQTAQTLSDEQRIREACYYLQGTHAMALYSHHEQRTFTLIIDQEIYRPLNATQLLQSIQWYKKSDQFKKGSGHEQSIKKNHQQQPHP